MAQVPFAAVGGVDCVLPVHTALRAVALGGVHSGHRVASVLGLHTWPRAASVGEVHTGDRSAVVRGAHTGHGSAGVRGATLDTGVLPSRGVHTGHWAAGVEVVHSGLKAAAVGLVFSPQADEGMLQQCTWCDALVGIQPEHPLHQVSEAGRNGSA